MPVTTITSMELDRSPQRFLDDALEGHVFITRYGKPAYVLLSYEEYLRLTANFISTEVVTLNS
jgi:prevent-host-death family protein